MSPRVQRIKNGVVIALFVIAWCCFAVFDLWLWRLFVRWCVA